MAETSSVHTWSGWVRSPLAAAYCSFEQLEAAMSVKARFYVQQVTRYAHSPGHVTVTLQAASRGEENKSWAAATPSGNITMNINNGAAGEWFAERLGKDVAITFEATPDEESHLTQYSR